MLKLKRFLKPYIAGIITASSAKLFEAFLEILLPVFMGKIIDIGIAGGDKSYVVKMSGIMLLTISVGLASATVCQYVASNTCQKVGNDLRKSLLKKISLFSYSDLDNFGNTSLINRLTNDVNQITMAVAMLMRLVSRAPFMCIGALVMAVTIDPKMAVIFAVLIPMFILVIAGIMKFSIPLYQTAQKKLDRLSGIFKENLEGVRVIRAFARHKAEEKRINDGAEETSKAYIRVSNISALMNPLTLVIMNMGIIFMLYYGGININVGNLSQGDVVILINYINQVLLALLTIADLLVMFTKAAASGRRINEIFEWQPSIKDNENSEVYEKIFEKETAADIKNSNDLKTEENDSNKKQKFRTDINSSKKTAEKNNEKIYNNKRKKDNNQEIIKFDHISFAYNTEEVLSDISFTINKGETVGIAGTTGSGKSTAANLIPRFYDVTKGAVYFKGKNVKDIPQTLLHQKIGMVMQKAVLFSGSIADNLRWGKKDASDKEVEEALKAAMAYDFVKNKKDGINEEIFEGGKNLSGGQKQRLSIARALIKKPEVIILDDSLSALDYETDKNLRQSLKENLKDTTAIIISQRLSSIINADKIIVLDDGICMGIGTHEELLKNCPAYREIYESQRK